MNQRKKNEQNLLESEPETGLARISQSFQKVTIASSGGVDSSVLFHLLCNWISKKKNSELAICHTNFGLRGQESVEDEMFLRDHALKSGVPFFLNSVSAEHRQARKSESLQLWARRIRYEHYRSLAAEGWTIALAHHRDDLAENVLLRLSRGTSSGAMAGLTEWNPPFWRPLLPYGKAEIRAYAREHRVPFREDSSNASPGYARNRIRHNVLPVLEELYPGAGARIARCGRESAEISEYCLMMLQEKAESLRHEGLALSGWTRLPASVQDLLISRAVGPAVRGRKSLNASFLGKVREHVNVRPDQTLVLTLPAGRGVLEIRNKKLSLRLPS